MCLKIVPENVNPSLARSGTPHAVGANVTPNGHNERLSHIVISIAIVKLAVNRIQRCDNIDCRWHSRRRDSKSYWRFHPEHGCRYRMPAWVKPPLKLCWAVTVTPL